MTQSDMKVVLISSDDERFVVDRKVAEKSLMIKNMLKHVGNNNNDDDSDEEEDDDDQNSEPYEIPISSVRGSVMKHVLDWCEHYKNVDFPTNDDGDLIAEHPVSDWDKEFLTVDQEMLYGIILAANYFNIKPLLDRACQQVANMIKGKSPEEIRKTFNISNDFTAEEEAAIRRENEWAEDR
ncbi:unnamed protein product [Kuraishia capsulata CBS 1993]|uniref:E3 ubiquitin ligase complex SCF subunit n=1 Tax=Kuraishia capsulata CBS 1993 TaxID=1382522 RepID=W6MSF4_9ASCO|nr:uncharacterized protein KUCA_T00005306001 [Kuraishia capsulata CBS 1993]CDK29318.1 unnamed protein product [Kuraishia capsulata CBS 1993]